MDNQLKTEGDTFKNAVEGVKTQADTAAQAIPGTTCNAANTALDNLKNKAQALHDAIPNNDDDTQDGEDVKEQLKHLRDVLNYTAIAVKDLTTRLPQSGTGQCNTLDGYATALQNAANQLSSDCATKLGELKTQIGNVKDNLQTNYNNCKTELGKIKTALYYNYISYTL